MWNVKQKMEALKICPGCCLAPIFSCQLQRPKDNVLLTRSGQQQGILGKSDAVFTMDFGNHSSVVFLGRR